MISDYEPSCGLSFEALLGIPTLPDSSEEDKRSYTSPPDGQTGFISPTGERINCRDVFQGWPTWMYHNGQNGCSPFRFLCKYGPTDTPHEVELTVSSMNSTSCDNYEEMCAGEDEADKGKGVCEVRHFDLLHSSIVHIAYCEAQEKGQARIG